MAGPREVIRGACPHDCPDTCAWEVTVEDGRAVIDVVAAQGDNQTVRNAEAEVAL